MPNDAKLGLVLGVGLTIAVAVLFFRKDGGAVPAAMVPAATAKAEALLTELRERSVPARTVGRTTGRTHVVAEGDTLFTLAEKYYQDKNRFVEIFQANRDVLTSPDRLPAGTELVIP